MQDIRIRIAAASLLSIAAFVSVQGAAAALAWWLLFCRGALNGKSIRQISFLVVLIAIFSGIIGLTGGDGITYFVRMAVLVLIGMWLYNDYHPGEFPDLCVWLLGDKAGFELGMIAESLVPTGRVLIHSSLARAEDTAELLAVRGYCYGGTWCPVFRTGRLDLVAGTAAIFVGIAAFVPVSEFFILYR